MPFEIPESWEWVRLSTICTKLVDGDHNPPKGVNFVTPFIMASSTNINNDALVDLEKVRYLSEEVFIKENERTSASAGDIFFTSVGSLGRSCVYDGSLNICFQRSVSVITTLIYNYYLKFFFDCGYFQQKVIKEATGTAQKGFYLNQLSSSLIPVPPLEEQKRIVDEIKKHLPHIYEYEIKKQKLDAINESFPEALKKSILQEAVMGKLVSQDSNDEPASVLLERIREEKQRLIAEGKLKKDKHESIIYRRDNSHYEKLDGVERCIDDEIPFEIPDSWEWIRLGTLFEHNTGKTLNQTKKEGILLDYITTSNLYWNRFKLESVKQMYFKESEIIKCTATKGDLLVCEGGDIGRAAIWNYDYDICIQNHIHKLRAYVEVSTEFYFYLFFLYKTAGWIGGKGIGIQGLSTNALHNILFPLPPTAEQFRIAKKIKILMKSLDSL